MDIFSFKMVSLISAFGALGVLARFIAVHFIAKAFPSFPVGTLTVNILGSFLIGCAFAFFSARSEVAPVLKILLVSGFLGGFTTFSSFSIELLEFYREGRMAMVFLYGVGSPILGFSAAALGSILTSMRLA